MHGDDEDDEDMHSLGSASECEEEYEKDEDVMDDADDFDDPGMFEDEQQEELQGAETMCAPAACKHITTCVCEGGGALTGTCPL